MYIVQTANFEDGVEFKTLDQAFAFMRDQLKMGFWCTVHERIMGMDLVADPTMPRDTIRLENGMNSVTVRFMKDWERRGKPGSNF